MITQKYVDALEYSFFFFFLCIIFIISEIWFEIGYLLIKNFIICVLFILILRSWKRNGIFSLYSLFLDFSLFFVFSRIFFDLINYIPLTSFLFFEKKSFSEEIIFLLLFKLSLFIILIDAGFYFSKNKNLQTIPLIESKNIIIISFGLYILTAFWFSYKAVLDIKSVMTYGYSALLSDIRQNYPFWLKGAGTGFMISFYSLLMQKQSRKDYKKIFVIFCIIMLLTGLRGSRASFLIPFLFALYILNIKKVINITFKELLFLVLVMIVFVLVITYYRGENISYLTNIKDLFFYIFYNQGNTFGLLPYYQENIVDIKNNLTVPIVFSDVLTFYNTSIHAGSAIVGEYANINRIKGIGLGQSLFLELYDLPFVLGIFVSPLIGKYIKFVETNLFKNRFYIVFLCVCVSSIIYMPRDILLAPFEPLNFVYIFGAFFVILFSKECERYFLRRN